MILDKKIKEMQENINSKLERMEEIKNKAVEETRAYTKEEKDEFESLEEEVRGLKEVLEDAKKDYTQSATSGEKTEEKEEELEQRAFVDYCMTGTLETRADSTWTKSGNSVVIPTRIANRILEEVQERSNIFKYAEKFYSGGDLTFPIYDETNGGMKMEYAEEFTEPNHTAGTFKSMTLKSYLARVTTLISKSLMNNTDFNLYPYIVGKMSESIADFIEKEAFFGTEGKMTGMSEAEVVGNTLTADSLIDLQDSIYNVYQKNCKWIMNRKTKNTIRKFKDGQGNYLLERDYTSGNGGWTLLGKPVELTDKLTEGDIFYGDYSGLAFKIVENPRIETLREKYIEQHAIGLCSWLEMDCNILVPQKIKRLTVTGE